MITNDFAVHANTEEVQEAQVIRVARAEREVKAEKAAKAKGQDKRSQSVTRLPTKTRSSSSSSQPVP